MKTPIAPAFPSTASEGKIEPGSGGQSALSLHKQNPNLSAPFDPAARLTGRPTRQLIHALPKTELHCHLDGSLRPSTVMDLARIQNVALPAQSQEDLLSILVPGEDCQSLEDYLKAFDVTCSVLQTFESLERVAYELVEDCAAENVWYVEVRYSPILHTRGGMNLTQIVDAVLHGLDRGRRDFNVESGLIICGMRNISPRVSLQLAELAVAYKGNGVVGFDLAGAEHNFPAKRHREAFSLILNNNINCTVHAGESYGPESISQAIHYCGAHRIGHGTKLKEDGDLLNYVNDHRIPLEICPTSNVQTRSVDSFGNHPLRFYFDYGIRVTINTDNRLVSNTTVTDELWKVVETFGFTISELRSLLIYGFKSSFLPYRRKAVMLARAVERMNKILATDSGLLEAEL